MNPPFTHALCPFCTIAHPDIVLISSKTFTTLVILISIFHSQQKYSGLILCVFWPCILCHLIKRGGCGQCIITTLCLSLMLFSGSGIGFHCRFLSLFFSLPLRSFFLFTFFSFYIFFLIFFLPSFSSLLSLEK